jgi:hypothetical protein
MERMEHIRGKLLDGEQVVLEGVDGYLACNDHRGRKSFYGYFEAPTDVLRRLRHETCYRLILNDGRKADVYTEIVPSNSAGNSVAEFHVTGGLKK